MKGIKFVCFFISLVASLITFSACYAYDHGRLFIPKEGKYMLLEKIRRQNISREILSRTLSTTITVKQKFVNKCLNNFLSDEILTDSMITTREYVEFLQEICVSSGNCNSNETPTFISLAVNVQVEFVWLLCPNKKQSCYEQYLNLPDLEQIKFNVSNFDENMLDERVQKFCTRLWRVTVEYHGGTSAPTTKPSLIASSQPSTAPIVNDPSGISSNISTQNSLSFDLSSKHLSKIPSKRPTKSPTKSPSKRPTKSPSKSPTKSPTKGLSKSPTKSPSEIPTQGPSKTPSRSPSKSPTKGLSKSPTKGPSKSLSRSPSKIPTKGPSRSPTKIPSKSPTKSPSKIPSKSPSNHSIKSPSKSPIKNPSKFPSNSTSNSVNEPPSETPSIRLKSIPLLESLGHPENSSNPRQTGASITKNPILITAIALGSVMVVLTSLFTFRRKIQKHFFFTEKENSSLQDLYIVDMQSSSHLSEKNTGINKSLHSKTKRARSNEDLCANECSTYSDDHSIFSNENYSNDRIFMFDESSLLSELRNETGMNDSNHASLSLLEMTEDDSDFYVDEDSLISAIPDEENFVCDILYNSSNENIKYMSNKPVSLSASMNSLDLLSKMKEEVFLENLVDTDDWIGIDITDSLSCSSNRMPGYGEDQQAAESISMLRKNLRRIEKNYSKESES